jgi:hypothetical protein
MNRIEQNPAIRVYGSMTGIIGRICEKNMAAAFIDLAPAFSSLMVFSAQSRI